MSVLDDIQNAVIDLAQATSPYATIEIGALPPDNGICMTYSSGSPDTTFMDKSAAYSMDMVCNGKHTDQQILTDALANIHEALTQETNYPTSENWQITNIITTSAPTYLDRQPNDWYMYGSSLQVKFYYRRANNA